MEWNIEFNAEGEEVQLTLTHDYRGPESLYINIDGFILEQVV